MWARPRIAGRTIASGCHALRRRVTPQPCCSAWSSRSFRSSQALPPAEDSGTVSSEDVTAVPSPRTVTKVEKLIADSIKATGPISIARYMQLCLAHPTEGYYMRRDVFGAEGDFITSPEISQTFGELLAVWFVAEWQASGRPKKTRLVELGPGRGTLISDILRTFSSLEDISASLKSVHLVENSRFMRTMQDHTLAAQVEQAEYEVDWHDDLEEIVPDPETYTMLVAHEFFDALPIHMLEKSEDGLREVVVDLAGSDPKEDVARINKTDYLGLRFAKTAPNTPLASILSQSSARFADLPNGSRMEISPQASVLAGTLARLVGGEGGGAALIVDYGDDRLFGSSLRAFREHRHVDLFDQPGMSDITANVDFAYLREAMQDKAEVHGPITQREFLMGLGLTARLDALMHAAETKERKLSIAHAARRLVDSEGMGAEYKVMAVTGRKGEPPYPFVRVDGSEGTES